MLTVSSASTGDGCSFSPSMTDVDAMAEVVCNALYFDSLTVKMMLVIDMMMMSPFDSE